MWVGSGSDGRVERLVEWRGTGRSMRRGRPHVERKGELRGQGAWRTGSPVLRWGPMEGREKSLVVVDEEAREGRAGPSGGQGWGGVAGSRRALVCHELAQTQGDDNVANRSALVLVFRAHATGLKPLVVRGRTAGPRSCCFYATTASRPALVVRWHKAAGACSRWLKAAGARWHEAAGARARLGASCQQPPRSACSPKLPAAVSRAMAGPARADAPAPAITTTTIPTRPVAAALVAAK